MTDLAEKLKHWSKSTKGQEILKKTLEECNKEIERLNKIQKVKSEDYNKTY